MLICDLRNCLPLMLQCLYKLVKMYKKPTKNWMFCTKR